ncbi:MAG: signal peptidase I [Oscillospiraceae bacterium]
MSSQREISIPSLEILKSEKKRLSRRKAFFKTLRNTVGPLIVVAAIAVLIATLIFPVLRVMGSSMAPTLDNDQIIICRKTGNFKKGDIIAFYYNNKILLKRVIATTGEKVDIAKDGTVIVDGEEIDEPYIKNKAYGKTNIKLPYQVPDEMVFVMGDNRDVSIDSRNTAVGCVSQEAILGKAVIRVWPFKIIKNGQ